MAVIAVVFSRDGCGNCGHKGTLASQLLFQAIVDEVPCLAGSQLLCLVVPGDNEPPVTVGSLIPPSNPLPNRHPVGVATFIPLCCIRAYI